MCVVLFIVKKSLIKNGGSRGMFSCEEYNVECQYIFILVLKYCRNIGKYASWDKSFSIYYFPSKFN